MRFEKMINNDGLTSELKYVDLKNESLYTDDKKPKAKIKDLIKFDFKSIDTFFYKNEIILTIISLILSIVSIFLGDLLSILNPIFMFCFITLLSSNHMSISNNRHLDVGVWNLISSFGIIIKSLNLSRISSKYEELTDFFTKAFLYSLIFSGIPAFNLIFILVTIGLITSHIFCFINKNIQYIKDSISTIESQYIYYMIVSSLTFLIFFRGSSVNIAAFTIIMCFKYFNKIIEEYDINIIKDTKI